MKRLLMIMCIVFIAMPSFAMSEKDIKQKIIQESIDSYPGNCACPYNSTKNGSSCGKRSAYSKGGGYAPLCYDSDITKEMINNYKKIHNIK